MISEFIRVNNLDLTADCGKARCDKVDESIDEWLIETRRFHRDHFFKEVHCFRQLLREVWKEIVHCFL